jgi:hypothetical protein
MGSAVAQIEYGKRKLEWERLCKISQTDRSQRVMQQLAEAKRGMDSAFELWALELGTDLNKVYR